MFGYKYALAPYAYLLTSFVIVDFLAPVMKTWRRNGMNRGQSWADYRFQLTRLGLQAESVASLKGVAYEHKIIRETYAQHRHDILVCDKAYFKFGIVRHHPISRESPLAASRCTDSVVHTGAGELLLYAPLYGPIHGDLLHRPRDSLPDVPSPYNHYM